MSKIFKLFINENIKTWKKGATKVLIIFIILSLFGVLALTKIMKKLEESSFVQYSTMDWKQYAQEEKANLERMMQDTSLSEETKKDLKIDLERWDMALKYDINTFSDYWKSDLLNQIVDLRYNDAEEKEVEKLIKIIENDAYSDYIQIQKETLNKKLEQKEILKDQYDDEMLILDLKSKNEIGKNENNEEYWKSALLSEIAMAQKSIRTGINVETRKLLTIKDIEKQKDIIKIDIYRIENNKIPIEYLNDEYRMMFETMVTGFVTTMIALFAVIIAGGEISTETSTGTIKFWALTPNKRWKILTAKILSVIFYIVVITLIMSILTIIVSNLAFDGEGTEYIYVKNGEIAVISNIVFMIELYFVKCIPVIIFAILAIMISTITRNTAAAVSFSAAAYIGNGIVMTIFNQVIKKDWVKYIPFNNLNLVDKIFTYYRSPMQMTISTSATSTSLQFSLAVLGVCVILMLVTMYDSFNNRDII